MPQNPAMVEWLSPGKPNGPMGQRLLAANMDVRKVRNHDLLTRDEWRPLDTVIQQVARIRTPAATELIKRGLVWDLPSGGRGAAVFEGWAPSDFTPASVTMNIAEDPNKGRINYEPSYL